MPRDELARLTDAACAACDHPHRVRQRVLLDVFVVDLPTSCAERGCQCERFMTARQLERERAARRAER